MFVSSVAIVQSNGGVAPQYAVVSVNQSLLSIQELQRRLHLQDLAHGREVARLIGQRREENTDVLAQQVRGRVQGVSGDDVPSSP